jgi:hypothetical protein
MDMIELLPAITSLGGVVVAAVVAVLVARQQFRGNVLSKNRQEWINKLRELLAEYDAILYDILANFRFGTALKSKEEGVSTIMKANLIRCQIKLFINPNEVDHVALLDLISKLYNAASSQDDKQMKEFTKLEDEYVALAQRILKREWERVKKGR